MRSFQCKLFSKQIEKIKDCSTYAKELFMQKYIEYANDLLYESIPIVPAIHRSR